MLQQPIAADGIGIVYEYSLDYIYIYIYFLHDRPWISQWIKSIYKFSRDRVTIVWPLWRHQQSIVTSSAVRKQVKWDTETIWEQPRLCPVRNKNMYVFSWWTVYALARVLFS